MRKFCESMISFSKESGNRTAVRFPDSSFTRCRSEAFGKRDAARSFEYAFSGRVRTEHRPQQRDVIRVPREKLKGKVPDGLTEQQKEDFILKACEHYSRFLRQRKQTR